VAGSCVPGLKPSEKTPGDGEESIHAAVGDR
jgi:hypothetical protein